MNAMVKTDSQGLLAKMAERYSVAPDRMLATLKATAFRGEVSNEQMIALLVVAHEYNLNPWLRQIYAFPDRNGIVPVVSVDGWCRIINEHPQFDGMDFEQTDDYCTCRIHRKDRGHPIAVTEYLSECRRDTPPWRSHPNRMLRHKAMIQCARLAFGFTGIVDPDDGARILERRQPARSVAPARAEVLPPPIDATPTSAGKPAPDPFVTEMEATEREQRGAQ